MTAKRRAKKAAKKSSKRAGRKAGATKRATVGARTSYRTQVTVAKNPGRTVKQRVAALAALSAEICDKGEAFDTALDVLRDTTAPSPVRLTALQVLQGATFSALKFKQHRPEYLGALRGLVRDSDLELRQRVLGILAREKDGRTQQLLLAGLRDPSKALVPPEKALQLLSYDIHTEAYPLAREIVKKPPNPDAKREALRLLAADAKSAPVFEGILRDKSQSADIRQISASALQALAPESLQSHAREIVMDDTEAEELRATGLVALKQFGKAESLDQDTALRQTVNRLEATTASEAIKRGARQFLGKGPE